MKAKARNLTPTKLRLLLLAALVLILFLTVGVFYLGYRQLETMAVEVGEKVAEANDSQNTIQELQKLKQDLEANQDVITKASLIAADGQNYSYQDQIVNDLTTYAARASMTISNITFSTTGAAGGAAPATNPAPAPAPASTESAPAGLKKTNISVTLDNPVDYKNLLNFLHYIEQNLTRLKVANVTLTKAEGGAVNTDVLNLEVYLR